MNIIGLVSARYLLIAYAGVITFMLSPLAVVLLSSVLATLFNCPPNVQLSNNVCTNGDIIYGISQAGWLLVFTLPIGIFLLILLVVVHIFLYMVIKKREVVAGYVLNKIRKKMTK